ncbi:M23 family metallopeptidase [bacterium]|nr:MAG: M23 family metallopeptidase [bacterium]
MRPLPLLGALLLSLPASAREKGNDREPKKEPTPIERACREKKVRITLAGDPPETAGFDGTPAPKPSLKEEADQAAAELGGRLQFWTDDQGDRTLRWHRGKKTPEQCVESLNALAARFPGRLLITDPRYGRSAEKIKVGSDVASAEVTKVEKALPAAEVRNSPGFFESFFDGGNTPAAAAAGPGFAGGPAGYNFPSSGDPSSPQAFWAAEGQRAAQGPNWRNGTNFPITFNRDSAAPPLPGSTSFPEPWWRAPVREVARTADRGVSAVRSAGSYVYEGVSNYAGKAYEWAKENLLRAPLASFSRISSNFGSRFHPIKKQWKHHTGVDYAAAYGTAVMAAGEGKVVSAGWKGGYGNAIVIQHASGTETLYGHLSSYGVRAGQTVTAGRVIGRVGSTGQSTGPHLHYEVRRGGRPVDPLKVASL